MSHGAKHPSYTKWCLVVLQYSLGQCLVDSLPNLALLVIFPFLVQKGKMSHGAKTPKIHEMVFGGATIQLRSMLSRSSTYLGLFW